MIIRVRSSVHDKQETGYTDDDILGYINDGVRLMRRTILDIAPALLADGPITGRLFRDNFVVMDKPITQVINVFADRKRMRALSKEEVANDVGRPYGYFISGFNTINFYPFLKDPIDYSITVVSDMQLLTMQDASPFPNDLDDFLYEYAVIRASISNEFDVSQETSIMSTIISQLENVVRNMQRNVGLTVAGYWDAPRKWPKYGRHG